jgi:hypothetical protein
MSHNGYDMQHDMLLTRQRTCEACKGYVTFDRVDSKTCACPLCSHRVTTSPNLVPFISAKAIAELVAKQKP